MYPAAAIRSVAITSNDIFPSSKNTMNSASEEVESASQTMKIEAATINKLDQRIRRKKCSTKGE